MYVENKNDIAFVKKFYSLFLEKFRNVVLGAQPAVPGS